MPTAEKKTPFQSANRVPEEDDTVIEVDGDDEQWTQFHIVMEIVEGKDMNAYLTDVRFGPPANIYRVKSIGK